MIKNNKNNEKVINYFLTYNKVKGIKYYKICYKEGNKTKTYLYLGNVEKIIKNYAKKVI